MDLNNKNILVTGGSGFIGHNLVKFIQNNYRESNIYIFDKTFRKFSKNIKFIKGDLLKDLDKLNKFKFDYIFHQAALVDTTVTDKKLMLDTNTKSFYRILDLAKNNNCKLIYASSAAVYGNSSAPNTVGINETPTNCYGESKLKMDKIALEFMKKNPNMIIIGLRYFNVYGHGEYHKKSMASMIYQLYLQMKQNKKPRIFKYGEQKRDFVYIKDVIQANINGALYGKSGIYNVGYGCSRSFNEIIKIINNYFSKNLDIEYINNPWTFYQNHTLADIKETKIGLKYNPKFNLENGIKDYFREIEINKQLTISSKLINKNLPDLTIGILTYNEEKNIIRCLNSIKNLTNNVLIVDSNSTDNTVELIKNEGYNPIQRNWKNHSDQRNFVIQSCKTKWLFFLDADEVLTEDLKKNIILQLSKVNCNHSIFEVNRKTFFENNLYENPKYIFQKDKCKRLLNITKNIYYKNIIHETPVFEGTVGFLKGDILHYSYENVNDYLTNSIKYSKLCAQQKWLNGTFFSMIVMIISTIWKFISHYILKRGFLDGIYGLIFSLTSAVYVFNKHVYLYELSQQWCKNKNLLVHVSSVNYFYGGERQVLNLIDGFKNKDEYCQILITPKKSELSKKIEKNNFIVKQTSKINVIGLIQTYFYLRKFKNYNKIILNINDGKAHIYCLLKYVLPNIKINVIRRIPNKISNKSINIIKNNADNIICISDHIKNKLINSFEKNKIKTIKDSIDIKRWQNNNFVCLKEELKIPKDSKIIGFIGQFKDCKNPLGFIEVSKILNKQDKTIHFFMFGSGELENQIKIKIKEYKLEKNVHLLGFQKDLPDLIQNIDLLLFLSKNEGLGTTLLDALYLKIPIISSNSGGITEIIKNDFNGLVYEINDYEGVSSGVMKILNDDNLRLNFVNNGFKFVQDYLLDNMIEKFVNVFKKL